jgi:hypothetical protein
VFCYGLISTCPAGPILSRRADTPSPSYFQRFQVKEVDSLSPIPPHHAMHDRDILPLHVVHNNFAHPRIQPAVPQKEQIPSLERGLHGP